MQSLYIETSAQFLGHFQEFTIRFAPDITSVCQMWIPIYVLGQSFSVSLFSSPSHCPLRSLLYPNSQTNIAPQHHNLASSYLPELVRDTSPHNALSEQPLFWVRITTAHRTSSFSPDHLHDPNYRNSTASRPSTGHHPSDHRYIRPPTLQDHRTRPRTPCPRTHTYITHICISTQ